VRVGAAFIGVCCLMGCCAAYSASHAHAFAGTGGQYTAGVHCMRRRSIGCGPSAVVLLRLNACDVCCVIACDVNRQQALSPQTNTSALPHPYSPVPQQCSYISPVNLCCVWLCRCMVLQQLPCDVPQLAWLLRLMQLGVDARNSLREGRYVTPPRPARDLHGVSGTLHV
jgi:hypothetical protein